MRGCNNAFRLSTQSQGTEQVWQYLPPLCQSSYLSSGHASDQHALATRLQYSVFAGMIEFMRAAGETRTQKHDKGDVEPNAKFDCMSKLGPRRCWMP